MYLPQKQTSRKKNKLVSAASSTTLAYNEDVIRVNYSSRYQMEVVKQCKRINLLLNHHNKLKVNSLLFPDSRKVTFSSLFDSKEVDKHIVNIQLQVYQRSLIIIISVISRSIVLEDYLIYNKLNVGMSTHEIAFIFYADSFSLLSTMKIDYLPIISCIRKPPLVISLIKVC